jgi:hypothetical protein
VSLRDHRTKHALTDWVRRQAKVGDDKAHRGPWVERKTKRISKRVQTKGPKR